MLKSGQVARIVRLADEGVSIRKISHATGVSRIAVQKVLQRRLRFRKLRTPNDYEETGHEATLAIPADELAAEPPDELGEQGLYAVPKPVFRRPPERCPTCGGKCYMPCLACRLRKRPARKKPPISRGRDSA